MRNLSLSNITAAVNGTYHGDASVLGKKISFVTTDSREASKGCLFAAIKGEKSDGHDFIAAAFDAGALCVIAERIPENTFGFIIQVESTEDALRKLAAFYREQFDIPVLGITGSVGKTTTKEMVASVLDQHYNTLRTEKNFNNELGVPLTLFRLRDEHEFAVIEMGINHFGEMSRLTNIVKPDMGLFTIIGFSHLEFLENREGVLKAKAEMLECIPVDGVLFLNGDDDLLRNMDCGSRKKILYGTTSDCDIYADNFKLLGLRGSSCDIVAGERRIKVKIPAFGAHMVYAALAGAAVGLHMGMSDSDISDGIFSYEAVGSRSKVIETEFCTIIDDCYNSNPSSVISGIASLNGVGNRKVCILGDMLELGDSTDGLHFAVGEEAIREDIDLLLTCGEFSQHIYSGAKSISSHTAVWHLPNKEELISVLPQMIKKNDAVLVKASRGRKFEDIVSALKELQ